MQQTRTTRRAVWLFALSMGLAGPQFAAAGQCAAKSAENTTALLELYTSEGCNSCPPADKWVRDLRKGGTSASQVVPLAFHVDYWDYIGWKDRFGHPDYAARQRTLARLNRSDTVYTPQLVINGKDARKVVWSDTFPKHLKELNGRKPRADIALQLGPLANSKVDLVGTITVPNPRDREEALAFVVVYENNLVTEVKAGENRGVRLEHDYVVREMIGPINIEEDGKLDIKRTLEFGHDWKTKDLGVAAFVQSLRTGDIMQAVQLPLCL